MNSLQAYQQFWSSFELEAYDDSIVPDDATLPYLTYSVGTANFDQPVMNSVSIWYKGSSWKNISQKALEIEQYIGEGGRIVKFDNGAIWIKRGVPFAQRMTDEDDSIRRIYLNIETEFIKE